MKKSTKIWLVIATCLLLAVGIIFGGVMTMLKWDFTKLSTVKYETNKHEITEAFNSITIRSNTSDVKILPTEGNKCEIVCIEKTFKMVKANPLTSPDSISQGEILKSNLKSPHWLILKN